ncbi:MAG: UDP-2,3-diacylglucosamine diphosphatase [Gammaproteobacteria bacterium]|nr:UDP-2,3-diacylglucosamine diphosphatase [Gammaproteobacteria bacterium]MBU1624874.1 UDP-2,3-diacylglucosamine diphosphatase [Gammaproteobacteria bacterium]MBU1982718.1 UDP-2,3-diacylglucosamine diphosphatase [Gammaproteobacteria bacterium]
MPHTLFISDLHLSESHPQTTVQFLRFMQDVAPHAEALYILGDLFEYWAGDDDLDAPFHRQICSALASLSSNSTKLYIMHGNRDFLMDEALAKACKATLLSDPTLVELYGQPTLLSHGDTLCTGDGAYQQFRGTVRSSEWRSHFLSQPLRQRKATIEQLRTQSEQSKRNKEADIMDVTHDAVLELLRRYDFPHLIHGHTHRPNKHIYHIDGHTCERWVLGDWDTQANALQVSNTDTQYLKFS